MKQTHLLVGEIVRPQGIRGEVKLRHFTDDPYRFEELDAILREAVGRSASDVHLKTGAPPSFRINGTLTRWDDAEAMGVRHVGLVAAVSPGAKKLLVAGGNQSNSVSLAWFDNLPLAKGGRLVGFRAPPGIALPAAPIVDDDGAPVSRNEA